MEKNSHLIKRSVEHKEVLYYVFDVLCVSFGLKFELSKDEELSILEYSDIDAP